jgi:hypothetical protein
MEKGRAIGQTLASYRLLRPDSQTRPTTPSPRQRCAEILGRQPRRDAINQRLEPLELLEVWQTSGDIYL